MQDFGTIRKRLQQGKKKGWGQGHFQGVHVVWRDMQLVFSNCKAFNSTPADASTRELTDQVSPPPHPTPSQPLWSAFLSSN